MEESSLPSQQDLQQQNVTTEETLTDGIEQPLVSTQNTPLVSDMTAPLVEQNPVIDQQKISENLPNVGVFAENKVEPTGVTVENAIAVNSDTPEELEKSLTGAGISSEITDSVKNPKIKLTGSPIDQEKPKKLRDKISGLKEKNRVKKRNRGALR